MAARSKLFPIVVACGMAGTLVAQESEAPALGLLEFLGSWEEGDDEWLIYDGLDQDAYEIDVVENVFEAEDAGVADDAAVADEAGDADGTEDTGDSGESNDVDGTDEVTAADAD
jgi:hypothetical protein